MTNKASVSVEAETAPSGHCWDDLVGDTELRVYRAYERERSLGRRPALLLIDLYNRVFGDRREPLPDALERFPSSCGEAAWDALEPLKSLLKTARAAGHVIVHTTNENRAEAVLGRATQRLARVDDEWGSEIVEPLTPIEGELVVYKTRASAFFGTPLSTHLQRLGASGAHRAPAGHTGRTRLHRHGDRQAGTGLRRSCARPRVVRRGADRGSGRGRKRGGPGSQDGDGARHSGARRRRLPAEVGRRDQ